MGAPQRSGKGTKSTIKIFANIFISFIGAGVLGLPFAFKEGGILEGSFIMLFVAVFSIKAMLLLIDCKYEMLRKQGIEDQELSVPLTKVPNGKDSDDAEVSAKQIETEHDINYGDVGFEALGPAGRTIVDVSLLISQIGFCCAYLIFISENLSTYAEKLSRFHWLLMLLPPLFLLTLLRELRHLAISSLFAQVSNLFAFLVVFWFDFEHAGKVRTHPKQMSLNGFPFFFAVAIYCYEGAGMILSLEVSLAIEVRHKFKRFFIITMALVTLLYIAFGVCGYMSFGAKTDEIITLNLPQSESSVDFAMVVKLSLCLALFFTYPVMMFPVTQLIEKRCYGTVPNTTTGNVLRLVMVALTGVVVVVVPNFASLMAFVGATCCMLLAFVLPGLFHMLIFRRNVTMNRNAWLLDFCLISMGVFGALLGTVDALKRMTAEPDTAEDVLMTSPWPSASTAPHVTTLAAATSPLYEVWNGTHIHV